MQCRHFGSCGSCSVYNMSYDDQLVYKHERLEELMKDIYAGEIDLFSSPDEANRARAEFRIWHDGDECSYAMSDISGNGVCPIDECPKVLKPISDIMKPLMEAINSSRELSKKLFGVEFMASTEGECILSMLYHRRLEDEWLSHATSLSESLGCNIIGRSRKQKVLTGNEYITQKIVLGDREYIYRYYDGAFIQPNPYINRSMLQWVVERLSSVSQGDLLEAYCGLGNFTLPLSSVSRKVLATEVSKSSIKAAKENKILNNIKNIEFARLSSEELTEAIQRRRRFRRLEGIDLDGYDFESVLVDPPRAGLDDATLSLASDLDNIVYISCNPLTLSRDLKKFSSTHYVVSMALFDQFPYTSHMECGAFLRRKHS